MLAGRVNGLLRRVIVLKNSVRQKIIQMGYSFGRRNDSELERKGDERGEEGGGERRE